MKRRAIFDKAKIAKDVAATFGDSIRQTVIAYLGDPTSGAVEVPIDVADHAGTFYIHGISAENLAITGNEDQTNDDKQFVTTASMTPNKIMPGQMIYGTAVKIRKEQGEWVIVDLGGTIASEYLYGVKDRLQRSVDISQIDFGLIRPSNPKSMRVIVSGSRYYLDGVAYDVPTLSSSDFTTNVPTTLGMAKAVQIKLNPVTSVLTYVWSSEFENSVQHSSVFSNYPNSIIDSLFSPGWVKVYNGMPSIDIVDIYPGQELLNKKSTAIPSPSTLFPKIIVSAGEVVTSDGEVVWYE